MQTFDTRLNVVSDSADSLLALLGHAVAPIFTPLGFGDWRMVTALVTGITAKEAVVSTLAVLFRTDVDALSTVIKLAGIMLHDEAKVKLFRRFLTIYDPNPQKFKEIPKLTSGPAEQAAFWER